MFKHKNLYYWVRNTLNNKQTVTAKGAVNRISSPRTLVHNKSTSTFCTYISQDFEKQINAASNYIYARSMASGAAAHVPKHTNRLAQCKSPYLLQHAHNPVDWYPWGEEAFERARNENKLIFLSVGYSTCHWCHVMEHESFENEEIAAIMNAKFINIKVDREERPDIDKIYMQFLLMTHGSGGWPMSVWLTPELVPIVAGTYFPPQPRWGVPSFAMILKSIASKWETDGDSIKERGQTVIDVLKKSLVEKTTEVEVEPGSADEKLKEAVKILKNRYDQEYGGFGSHPKFPEVSRLNFLFHAYIVTKDIDVLDMVLQTLDNIGRGGINDHVFGGFARYSVDRKWHVPHFEKMLYDQGQLISAYANAYKLTHSEKFLTYADNIFRYLLKNLRHPAGGFYAGEDADSLPTHEDTVKVEGAFYAWTWDEIKAGFEENNERFTALKDIKSDKVFDIYAYHYGLEQGGNVEPSSDPQGHLKGKNILIVDGSEEDTCTKFDISCEKLKSLLEISNEILNNIREKRPRPHLDTKIICSWNGLTLSGLSKLANCGSPKREEYIKAAKQLVDFSRKHFFDSKRKVLLRSCYGAGNDSDALAEHSEHIDGFLDDYAFLIKGLLDYYKASLDMSVLRWAKELQDIQDAMFWDNVNGAYYYSQVDSPNVIIRLKEDHDGAEPCGNSIAARNLTLLAHYYDDDGYRDRAAKLFQFFADVTPLGYALPEMLSVMLLHQNGLDLVAVVGPDSPDTKRFVEICRKFYIPGMIILHVDPLHPDSACNQRVQNKFKMVNGKTTVYICHDRVCRMPVTDPEKLEENLMQNFFHESI